MGSSVYERLDGIYCNLRLMPVLIRRETMLINPAAFIDQLAQAFLGRHESFIFIWEFSLNTKNEKSYYSLRLLCFIGMK